MQTIINNSVKYTVDTDEEDGYHYICNHFDEFIANRDLPEMCAFVFSNLDDVGFLAKADYVSETSAVAVITQVYAFGKLYDISDLFFRTIDLDCEIAANADMVCIDMMRSALVLYSGGYEHITGRGITTARACP